MSDTIQELLIQRAELVATLKELRQKMTEVFTTYAQGETRENNTVYTFDDAEVAEDHAAYDSYVQLYTQASEAHAKVSAQIAFLNASTGVTVLGKSMTLSEVLAMLASQQELLATYASLRSIAVGNKRSKGRVRTVYSVTEIDGVITETRNTIRQLTKAVTQANSEARAGA